MERKKQFKRITKKQWARALRSGKYKQGRNLLNHAGRQCCLGVLCLLSGGKEAVAEFRDGNSLTTAAQRFFKMTEHQHNRYIDMNDGGDFLRQHSFKEIADVIEGKMKPQNGE